MNRVLFASLCFVVTVIVVATLLLGDDENASPGAPAAATTEAPSRDHLAYTWAQAAIDMPTDTGVAELPDAGAPFPTRFGAQAAPPADPAAAEDWGDVAPSQRHAPSALDNLGLAATVPTGPVFDAERGARLTTEAGGRRAIAADPQPAARPTGIDGAVPSPAMADRHTAPSRAASDTVSAPPADDPTLAAVAMPTPRAAVPDDDVRTAQRLLNALGYDAGPADGLLGRRTRAAVQAYQGAVGQATDGKVTPALLAHLQRDHTARLHARRLAASRSAGPSDGESEPSILASIVSRFQEFTGRDLNSRSNPAGIDRYCSSNPTTWVYDAGVGALIYCDRWVKQRRLPTTAENPSLR